MIKLASFQSCKDDSTHTNVIHHINKIQNPHSHPIRRGVYDVTYLYLKIIKMNLFTKLKETKKLVVTNGERIEEREIRSLGFTYTHVPSHFSDQ